MPIGDNARSAEAIRRKSRALAAVFLDPAATEHEKAIGPHQPALLLAR
jgi:hypothetical protein